MSNEPIRGDITDFFHKSGEHTPAHYTAYRDTIYRCGKCGRNIEKSHWPSYCPNCGAYNDRPE